MQFIDLKRQQERILQKIESRIATVFKHGQYIMGPEVAELEENLCQYTQAKHCLGVASGSTALDLVLMAWGIGPGDAVFTTPLSFIATGESIAKTGAIPIFVDINHSTFNLDTSLLEKAIQAVLTQNAALYPLPLQAIEKQLKPKAIVPVDLFGYPADYHTILHTANKYQLKVLEDAAQGFGGFYEENSPLCNCGCTAATTSFFPAKPLGCYGDGGAVFTNNDELAALIDALRYHGRADAQNKNDNIRLGCNGRLDTLQAGILLAKLEIFEEEMQARQNVAAVYTALLAEVPEIISPPAPSKGRSTWAQYTIQLPEGTNRALVMEQMKSAGIPTVINYPKGMHRQGAFAYLKYSEQDFPQVEKVTSRVLSLPMHPYITQAEQEYIVGTLVHALY